MGGRMAATARSIYDSAAPQGPTGARPRGALPRPTGMDVRLRSVPSFAVAKEAAQAFDQALRRSRLEYRPPRKALKPWQDLSR